MSIDSYLSELEAIIASSPVVSASTITIDRKSNDIAFISGVIEFRTGAALDFKEFIESTGRGIEKYKYAYNYRIHSDFLFRYDNSPDPRAKGLKTFPHHKHVQGEEIVESAEVSLAGVLEEIESKYGIKED